MTTSMLGRSAILLATVAFLAAEGCAQAQPQPVTVDTGAIRFIVSPDGGGFVDQVEFGGKTVASFGAVDWPAPVGYETTKEAAEVAEALAGKINPKMLAAACKLTQGKSKHGHSQVTMENGLVRVVVIPDLGARIIELSDLVTGQNHVATRYNQDKLPDLSKRAYLGGYEDCIDRNDDAWKTPYAVKVLSETADRLSILFSADVENPGEHGNKLRIERTMSLAKGSPVLAMSIKYTVTGGPQSIVMMPHPEPVAGAKVDDADYFYVASKGGIFRASVKADNGKDIIVPLDESDSWAGVCDINERHAIINTFRGPMESLDVYIADGTSTLEPYTKVWEQQDVGKSMSLEMAYWSCYNLDAIHFADERLAGELLLRKELVGRGEPLQAKVALVSSGAAETLTVTPKVMAGPTVVATLPSFEMSSTPLIAKPQIKSFNIDNVVEGDYMLVLELARTDKTVSEMRAPFTKKVSRGSYVDWFVPTVGTKGASRFAVLGQTKQTTAVVARIDKKEAPEVTTVTIDGQFVCRDRSQPPIPFQTLLTVRKGSSNIEVVQTITLPAASAMVKEWAFNLPLVFRGGRFGTKTMVGNDHKYPDIWHLDQSFEQYWGWLLSDKMRWPLWRFGGLLIDSPTHYSIWKTNAADTSATVTYEGNKPPGWLDASDSNDWGVTAVLGGEAMANGPRAITFNGENGALSVGLHPSQVPPLAVTDAAEAGVGLKAGKPVTAKFSLEFHPLRHPTRSPPELTDEQYAALLHLMKDHWSFSSTNFTMMAGVDMDKNTDALIRKLVLADTPPSAMLRTTPGLIAVAMGKLDPAWKPSGDVEADIKVLFQKVRATPVTAPAAK